MTNQFEVSDFFNARDNTRSKLFTQYIYFILIKVNLKILLEI